MPAQRMNAGKWNSTIWFIFNLQRKINSQGLYDMNMNTGIMYKGHNVWRHSWGAGVWMAKTQISVHLMLLIYCTAVTLFYSLSFPSWWISLKALSHEIEMGCWW
jgi:hypothetical protein